MSLPCCGLDFGTSNSTIGIVKDNQAQLIPLEANRPLMRSAIFCDNDENRCVFGQKGIDHYLEGGSGRLMMSLKSVLGSSLMEDTTLVFNEMISYSQILGHFIKNLKTTAEKAADCELTQVVMGRPVHFHDSDKEQDAKAQNTLESIARDIGFKEIAFQFEPIAAAMTYETTLQSEQLALIIDMGGGTSDFTVIRLQPGAAHKNRQEDVLSNDGIHIAGTDFDQRLSLKTVMPLLGMGSLLQGASHIIEVPASYYYDLTTWHTLNQLYNPVTLSNVARLKAVARDKHLLQRLLRVLQNRSGHHLLDAVEMGKQRLSSHDNTLLDLNFIEHALALSIHQSTFNLSIDDHIQSIIEKIKTTVKSAGVTPEQISALFYTGGSSKIPIIREKINALFLNATIVQGDAFGSVGMGLTLEARRIYNG